MTSASSPESGGLMDETLEPLLSYFDPDREIAGEQYLILQRKLILYFHARNRADAEDLADETLNRVSNKIASKVEVDNISAYSYKVAGYVYLECLKKASSKTASSDQAEKLEIKPVDELEKRESARLLEKCLKELNDEEAKLFIQYWVVDEGSLREARKRLAEDHKISLDRLRLRVHRIKCKLEKLLRKQLGDHS